MQQLENNTISDLGESAQWYQTQKSFSEALVKILEYLEFAKPDDLSFLFEAFKDQDEDKFKAVLRKLPSYKQECIRSMYYYIENWVSSQEEKVLLNFEALKEIFLDSYLEVQTEVVFSRDFFTGRIERILSVISKKYLGFSRKVFPNKTRFKGNTQLGRNVATSILSSQLLGDLCFSSQLAVPTCEILNEESEAFKPSKNTLVYLSLDNKNDLFEYLTVHPEMHMLKYHYEITYQIFKALFESNRKVALRHLFRLLILIYSNNFGKHIFRFTPCFTNSILFQAELKNCARDLDTQVRFMKENSAKSFLHELDPPKEAHTFVVDIPDVTDTKRFEKYDVLPEQIKTALASGNFDTVKEEFTKLDAENLRKFILICSQQGFFYFAVEIDMDDFESTRAQVESIDVFSPDMASYSMVPFTSF